jgi:hypothetical protein
MYCAVEPEEIPEGLNKLIMRTVPEKYITVNTKFKQVHLKGQTTGSLNSCPRGIDRRKEHQADKTKLGS